MNSRKSQVREPVQVYLDDSDQRALNAAVEATGLSKAEVLRRGLRRFAAEMLADESPALAFLESVADAPTPAAPPDVAMRHDEYLADWEKASWSVDATTSKPRSRRK